MTKLSNQVIEKLAVEAIQNEVSKNSPLLNSKLNVGDKEISFDGALELHESDQWSTKTFVANVPVQIKGKQDPNFNQKNVSFSLKLDHYENYYNNGGVLFFLVLVNQDRETKIYYKQLLPLELNTIINNHKHQKSYTMKLIPLENFNIQDICIQFNDSQRKQPTILIDNRSSSFRLMNRLVMRSSTFRSKNLFDQEIFDHGYDIYYGYNDEVLLPSMHAKINKIKMSVIQTIFIDNEITDVKVTFVNQKDQFSIIFEDVFQLEYDLKKGMIRYSLKAFGSLRKQNKVLPVIIAFLSKKDVKINEFVLPKTDQNIKSLVDELNQFKDLLYIIERSLEAFHEYGVSIDLPITQSEDINIYDQLSLLNQVVIDKRYDNLDLSDFGFVGLAGIPIGDISLVTIYDSNHKEKFKNPFKTESRVAEISIEFKNNKIKYPYNIFSLINVDGLKRIANIDAEKIIYEFDRINPFLNSDIGQVTQSFCLDCIRAYDQSGKKYLLTAAQYILKKDPNYTSYEKILELKGSVSYLNVAQIDIRLTSVLSAEQEDIIRDIILEANNRKDFYISFGASILLNNKKEADYYLKKLEPKEQESLKKYPIYTLYERL